MVLTSLRQVTSRPFPLPGVKVQSWAFAGVNGSGDSSVHTVTGRDGET